MFGCLLSRGFLACRFVLGRYLTLCFGPGSGLFGKLLAFGGGALYLCLRDRLANGFLPHSFLTGCLLSIRILASCFQSSRFYSVGFLLCGQLCRGHLLRKCLALGFRRVRWLWYVLADGVGFVRRWRRFGHRWLGLSTGWCDGVRAGWAGCCGWNRCRGIGRGRYCPGGNLRLGDRHHGVVGRAGGLASGCTGEWKRQGQGRRQIGRDLGWRIGNQPGGFDGLGGFAGRGGR